MPLARIDLPSGELTEYRQTIGDVVYQPLINALKAPKDNRFRIISEHSADEFVTDTTYFGIERSPDASIIQLTLNEGLSVEVKKAFYRAFADRLSERLGVRREHVVMSSIEMKKENWSFGNGITQHAEG